MPTVLDWAGIKYPDEATAGFLPAKLGGSSLLPLLDSATGSDGVGSVLQAWRNTAFGSHHFHSVFAYYPMRSLRTPRYRLIHNLNYNQRFPILEDVSRTTTWKMLQAAGEAGNLTGW